MVETEHLFVWPMLNFNSRSSNLSLRPYVSNTCMCCHSWQHFLRNVSFNYHLTFQKIPTKHSVSFNDQLLIKTLHHWLSPHSGYKFLHVFHVAKMVSAKVAHTKLNFSYILMIIYGILTHVIMWGHSCISLAKDFWITLVFSTLSSYVWSFVSCGLGYPPPTVFIFFITLLRSALQGGVVPSCRECSEDSF